MKERSVLKRNCSKNSKIKANIRGKKIFAFGYDVKIMRDVDKGFYILPLQGPPQAFFFFAPSGDMAFSPCCNIKIRTSNQGFEKEPPIPLHGRGGRRRGRGGWQNYKFPLSSCSLSIASKSALKLPFPKLLAPFTLDNLEKQCRTILDRFRKYL